MHMKPTCCKHRTADALESPLSPSAHQERADFLSSAVPRDLKCARSYMTNTRGEGGELSE